MKLNWKVRFQNPTFIITFLAAALALIYQALALFNIVPALTQDSIMQIVTMAVNLLVLAGVLIDPTTPGVGDSERALTYTQIGKN